VTERGLFEAADVCGMHCVRLAAWREGGFEHGFCGRAKGRRDERESLCAGLGLESVLRVRQVHGRAVVDLAALPEGPEAEAIEADAILIDSAGAGRRAAAVATADCVPILLRCGSRGCLVHAGWRGLAAGVVPAAAHALGEPVRIEAAVGPCACGMCYEVGAEVLDAIGPAAHARPAGRGKFLLDLAGTAADQLAAAGLDRSRIHVSGVCTIEDTRFHSYRRDGAAAGRNLSFMSAC